MPISHLPPNEQESLNKTLTHTDNGTVPEDKTRIKWGTKFRNNENRLPGASGAESPYKEYRVPPEPGTREPGARRVVENSETGDIYYTWTHYGDSGEPAFVKIR